MSSRAPAGVSATRYSSGLISLATPIFMPRASLPSLQEQKPHQGLRVLDLRDRLVDGEPHELDLLLRLPALEAGGEEEIHALVAEAGCREEGRKLLPRAAVETGFLAQLALRRLERHLPLVDHPGRQLEQLAARGNALLTDQHDPVAVQGDDRHRRPVDDDVLPLDPVDAEHRPLIERHRQDLDRMVVVVVATPIEPELAER